MTHLSVSTVTLSLIQLLSRLDVDPYNLNLKVVSQAPESFVIPFTENLLNVFLFKIEENQAYKNYSLPVRNANGIFVNTPVLGLNLQYVLTAYAKDDNIAESHKFLSGAMQILNEQSGLVKNDIDAATATPENSIKENILLEQKEAIKFSFKPYSLDDMSKLWSMFQTKYRLSAVYEASVVILRSDVNILPTIPVTEPSLTVTPTSSPEIDNVEIVSN